MSFCYRLQHGRLDNWIDCTVTHWINLDVAAWCNLILSGETIVCVERISSTAAIDLLSEQKEMQLVQQSVPTPNPIGGIIYAEVSNANIPLDLALEQNKLQQLKRIPPEPNPRGGTLKVHLRKVE